MRRSSSSPTGPAAGPRREGSRARLLAAGTALFSQKGYAATGTREIASLAGCNVSMIKYYFGSKEGLLRAIVLAKITGFGDRIRELATEPIPASDRLTRLVDAAYTFLEANGDFIRIVFREVMASDSTMLDEVRDRIRENQAAFAGLLGDAGGLGPDPRYASVLVFGMLIFYFVAYPLTSRVLGPKSPEVLKRLKETALAVLAGGLVPAGDPGRKS